MAVIDDELLRDAKALAQAQEQAKFETAEVLELFTFVILDRSLSVSATADERRSLRAAASLASPPGWGSRRHSPHRRPSRG